MVLAGLDGQRIRIFVKEPLRPEIISQHYEGGS